MHNGNNKTLLVEAEPTLVHRYNHQRNHKKKGQIVIKCVAAFNVSG